MALLPEDYKGDEKESANQQDGIQAMGLMADGDMDKILEEIEKQPLVSDRLALDSLLKEFADQKNFTRQMNALIAADRHNEYRQMRRDGSCFYRAFLLGLFETIESNRDLNLLSKVSEQVMTSLHRLTTNFGYESFTIEDFYYTFLDELQFYQKKIESGAKAEDGMGNSAIERMSHKHHAPTLIFWARMMASLQMRENEDDYAPFIPQEKGGMVQYLRSDVEALKSEADHIQTVAMSKGIGVPITIYCLENIAKGGPQTVRTIPNKRSCFDLLFRPGHYDLLYRSDGYDEEDEMKNESTNTDSNNNSNANNNANNDMEQKENFVEKEEDTKDSDIVMESTGNDNEQQSESTINAESNNNGNTASD